MKNILHDFSLRADLAWHAEVIGAVLDMAAARGIDVLITGAFARDLHLRFGYGIAQEIVEDLEAALEQFRLIAGDLAGAQQAESENA